MLFFMGSQNFSGCSTIWIIFSPSAPFDLFSIFTDFIFSSGIFHSECMCLSIILFCIVMSWALVMSFLH